MDESSGLHSVILSLGTQAKSSPYFTTFLLLSLWVLFTRLRTGLEKSKRQNQVSTSEKNIPILPYWIPYIGHAPEFAWSFDDLLAKGRNTTKDGMFGIHMMGSKHYMVLMPSLVHQFFGKRSTVLSGQDFLGWIFTKYFGDGGATANMESKRFQTVHQSLNQLLKEPFLSRATEKTVQLVESRTPTLLSFDSKPTAQAEWESMANVVRDGKSAEVDLFPLLMNYVADVATNVLMGDAFLKNNPGITQDLWEFDSKFNALLTGIPIITPGLVKAKEARKKLNFAVSEWNHAAMDTMNGKQVDEKWADMSDISESMRSRLKALQSIEAPEPFAIAQNLAVYWGLMVNANKVNFWMLLHIISSPKLLSAIQEEITPFAKFSPDTEQLKLDIDSLMKQCPLLKATFFETMRFYTSGVSYKKVLQDVTLTESAEDAATFGKPIPQTYHIAKGNFLVIPHAVMQMDPRIWDQPTEFNPHRFLVPDETSPDKMRAEMGHLHSFGGGTSVCKGRFFAEREVLIFTAGLLVTWNFSPVDGGKWKIPGKSYNGTGSANPKGNVRVRMSRRV
ncbi:cytochrome P450 [Cadophora sp. DSE1049]|nr:cytochrome P450 [Cadophora sp. DSE1049]